MMASETSLRAQITNLHSPQDHLFAPPKEIKVFQPEDNQYLSAHFLFIPLYVLFDQVVSPVQHHHVQRPRPTNECACGRANRHRRSWMLLGRRAHVQATI